MNTTPALLFGVAAALALQSPASAQSSATNPPSSLSEVAPATTTAASSPQPAALLGTLREQGTREPLAGIKIAVELKTAASAEAPSGTSPQDAVTVESDADGHFSVPALTAGTYQLKLKGPRIVTTVLTEQLSDKRLQVVYYVATRPSPFEAVIRAAPVRRELVETTLSAAEIKRSPGGQNDAIRAVQNLPGVARAPFGTGQLVVWGSAPTDTRVYADGVLIPRVYHFGGLRSTINSEFVEQLTFRPGAYGADFGRGLGGVIDVTTRRPKSDRLHGSATLDLIDGSLTLEGPVTKKLHVAAAARLSWVSVFLPIFNSSKTQLLPFYWDYQLSAHYQASERDDLDVLIFGATSNVTAKVDATDPNDVVNIDSKSYFGRARIRYTHRFSKDTVLWLMPSLGGDSFTVDSGDQGLAGQALRLKVVQLGYNLRAELRQKLLPFFDYAIGVDFEGVRARVETVAPIGRTSGEGQGIPVGGGDMIRDAGKSESGFLGDSFFSHSSGPSVRELLTYHLLQTAPYLITRFRFADDRLVLSPQLRISIDHLRLPSDAQATTPTRTLAYAEPRLQLRAQLVRDRLALKAGLGQYSQAPQGAELSPRFGNPQLRWQRGTTYVVGLELELPHGLHAETQGFYKDLRSLVVQDEISAYNNDGLGRVYGGELLIRQPLWHNLTGFVAYTLSRSERRDSLDQLWRVYRFDQTHILTVLATYKLPWGLDVGARFRYVTGNPTTLSAGSIRDANYQFYDSIDGELLGFRLPDFHQLDLRVDKTFTMKRWRLGLYLEVQNVYNRKNAESLIYGGRQLYQEGRVTGLPIFPNLGVRGDF